MDIAEIPCDVELQNPRRFHRQCTTVIALYLEFMATY
jgi:hypothetical protein